MPHNTAYSTLYTPTIGLLYVFNLIVGTGALALPKAFQSAGYAFSILVLLISCSASFISATFVIESLSIGNAVIIRKRKEAQISDSDDVNINENIHSSFEIYEKLEVSQMASMFLGRAGVIFSYFALNVYLFGDLAIYSTTVPKSLMNIICTPENTSFTPPSNLCRNNWPSFFDRFTVYRLCVILFILLCVPMIIIGITKTKYLQLTTTITRWSAFILMIFLASAQMTTNGIAAIPRAVNVHGFGSLFGVAVYAFMCHHSLPSLITPMSSKSGVFAKLSCVYLLIIAFYFTLSLTGSFAFAQIQDVYTLNFLHDDLTSAFYFICDHFLALFPVFTLTTNYPIVGITLVNNMRVLRDMLMQTNIQLSSEDESLLRSEDDHDQDLWLRRNTRPFRIKSLFQQILLPVLVVVLPTIISLMTDDVLFLTTVTGCYPGVAVQFFIPCLLVASARTYAKTVLNFPVPKKHGSPFQSKFWSNAIFAWAVFAVIMVTFNIFGFPF